MTVESTLDGKVVAATTAPYLATELQRQQVKQNNRLGRRGITCINLLIPINQLIQRLFLQKR